MVLIGSTVSKGSFHAGSDIDLVVYELADDDYFKALSDCWHLLPSDFSLDLLPGEDVNKAIRGKVEEEGRELI